ncbi:hypothetical protein T459_10746 [Capsicum annuum]|uniref:Tr-type G domain-containing protein n=1 Tax=Capsicum annuum TaxID=4072 RepID=A0A2G3A361_CAPAN|nr:hypothetical protein T459_10746 [Capsicum annuum]
MLKMGNLMADEAVKPDMLEVGNNFNDVLSLKKETNANVRPTHVAVNRKRHLNVVFIGHVDAGKSTAGGQILFLSGQVDDRTIQKYEKEAKDKSRESW